MSTKSDYNAFAEHYDSVVGERKDIALYIKKLIKRCHPRAQSVLELGCGSGSMLEPLSLKYACTGIDSSRAMLKIAKKKAPRCRLIEGDITNFSLHECFDVVLCPFDTINHIASFKLWKKTFSLAHRHLNQGGIFIFDVNTETKMEDYRLDPVTAEVEDDRISFVEVSRQRRYHYTVHLTLLKKSKGKLFQRYQMHIPELIVPTEKITEQLAMHFRRVDLIDPDRGVPSEETTELFFVCSDPR